MAGGVEGRRGENRGDGAGNLKRAKTLPREQFRRPLRRNDYAAGVTKSAPSKRQGGHESLRVQAGYERIGNRS